MMIHSSHLHQLSSVKTGGKGVTELLQGKESEFQDCQSDCHWLLFHSERLMREHNRKIPGSATSNKVRATLQHGYAAYVRLYSCAYMFVMCRVCMCALRILRSQRSPVSTIWQKSSQLLIDRNSIKSWAREAATGQEDEVRTRPSSELQYHRVPVCLLK